MKSIEDITIEEYLFDTPLYSKFLITRKSFESLDNLINTSYEIDGYNPHINQQTTFLVSPANKHSKYENIYWYSGISLLTLSCKRGKGAITVFSNVEQYHGADNENLGHIEKIGQYPSVADMHISQFRGFKKVIDKDSLKEITRAIGLAANGVGIGSFVYLRRIIEFLVFETFEGNKDRLGLTVEEFRSLRMEDKIKSLRGHLPDFLVKNHSVYAILSRGIHELNEQECLEYFPILLKSIKMILEQKKESEDKKAMEEDAQKEINEIMSKLNKKD